MCSSFLTISYVPSSITDCWNYKFYSVVAAHNGKAFIINGRKIDGIVQKLTKWDTLTCAQAHRHDDFISLVFVLLKKGKVYPITSREGPNGGVEV
jgi:hypothetical protein